MYSVKYVADTGNDDNCNFYAFIKPAKKAQVGGDYFFPHYFHSSETGCHPYIYMASTVAKFSVSFFHYVNIFEYSAITEIRSVF